MRTGVVVGLCTFLLLQKYLYTTTLAAVILNVSVRHIRRLLNRISTLGAQSLAHAARGRPSNRRYSEDFKVEILKIIHK